MNGKASTAAAAVTESTPQKKSRVMDLPMVTSHDGEKVERGS